MSLTVRPATAEDMEAVCAIYAPAVLHGTATFEIDPPDTEEMRRRWQAVTGAGNPYLVAELVGRVIGYAYAGPYHARPAYRFAVENSVYVDPAFQGRGAGHALMAALLPAIEARGYRKVVAVIGDSGNAASIALHRAFGFTHVGILRSVGWKHGRWLDTVYMERALGAGDSLPA